MSGHFPSDLAGQVAWLVAEIGDMKRRDRNRKRTGIISEVDTAKGLARVKFEDRDKPYIGPWMPWKEIAAGGIKSHIPPTVGEQVDVVSESGDLTDGVIDMSTPSNANPRPHDGPEAVITKGNSTVFMGDDVLRLTAPEIIFEGAVHITGSRVDHNGTNIGDTHKHTDVMPGGSLTGLPT